VAYFRRDGGRRTKRESAGLAQRLGADPSLMQLLSLGALRAEAEASGHLAHRLKIAGAGSAEQARALLGHAVVLQEIGRRTGEAEALARAASATSRARLLAEDDRRLQGRALLRQAGVLALAGSLFSDLDASKTAVQRLDEASQYRLDAVDDARSAALRATLLARRALVNVHPGVCAAAAAALAAAARNLDRLATLGRVDASEGHEARCDLGELLAAQGAHAKDRCKVEEAVAVLNVVPAVLARDQRPLTWARLETLRAQALVTLGDLGGEATVLESGVLAATRACERLGVDHSPLDMARTSHILALGLQALAEASDDERLFDRADGAFARAVSAFEGLPHLPLRSIIAHDTAACMARRAERSGDLAALEEAERSFRDALKRRTAAADPVAWAVTQVAMARIYEAQADLRGDAGERSDAAFALSAALDVFAEHGLRTLAESALTALERVRSLSPDLRERRP